MIGYVSICIQDMPTSIPSVHSSTLYSEKLVCRRCNVLFAILTCQFVVTFLQQAVAGLKSVVALCKESVTAQSVALEEDLEVVKKAFLHAVLEREEASHRTQQDLQVQLKAKFEVMRD